MNWGALIQGASFVAKSPVAKGGSLATLIGSGLYLATFAGVAIPTWAFSAAPIAGYLLYRVLPKSIDDKIDGAAEQVAEVVNEVPNTYQEYPTGKNNQSSIQGPEITTNINQSGS